MGITNYDRSVKRACLSASSWVDFGILILGADIERIVVVNKGPQSIFLLSNSRQFAHEDEMKNNSQFCIARSMHILYFFTIYAFEFRIRHKSPWSSVRAN